MKKIIYNNDGSILKEVENFKASKKYIKVIKSWGIFSSVILVILSILAGIRKVSIFNYYGINPEFFKYNIQDIFIVGILNFIIWFVVFILPAIIRGNETKDWISKSLKFISFIFIALIIGIYYSKNILQNYKVNNEYISNIIVTVIVLITYLGMYFMYYNLNILNEKEKIKKSKFLDIMLFIKLFCLLVLLIIMIVFTLLDIFAIDIKSNQKYTKIQYKDDSYVILLVIDNRVVIASYDENKCTINCEKYQIVDPKGCEMEKVVFDDPPQIIK